MKVDKSNDLVRHGPYCNIANWMYNVIILSILIMHIDAYCAYSIEMYIAITKDRLQRLQPIGKSLLPTELPVTVQHHEQSNILEQSNHGICHGMLACRRGAGLANMFLFGCLDFTTKFVESRHLMWLQQATTMPALAARQPGQGLIKSISAYQQHKCSNDSSRDCWMIDNYK